VPAGYDYANVPERGYGLAARRRGWLPKLVGRLCDVALPISKQTEREFLALVPGAAERTHLAYLALEPERWLCPEGVVRDDEVVVTVGHIDDEAWSRKGIDRFVELARRDGDRRYVLGGQLTEPVARRLAGLAPPNLVLAGRLDHDELRALFWSAGVYAQLSWHETFGVAMAEAMLCGCVPLISTSAALGEVASPWAVVAGRKADRLAMREEVAARFTMAARTETLARAVRGEL
jgi:glycosyltransferase involved in cell wall biosynthesis